jgi:siroheme synthase
LVFEDLPLHVEETVLEPTEHVVRLKGGDPFVFGRGSAEVAALADAGIHVEVVPGVSSALAAPALAGIPLTDRWCASSFTVVSGHRADGTDHLASVMTDATVAPALVD